MRWQPTLLAVNSVAVTGDTPVAAVDVTGLVNRPTIKLILTPIGYTIRKYSNFYIAKLKKKPTSFNRF